MATTNLFGDPVFRDGAFTSNDAQVRAYALQKTMRSIDLGVELGAATYVFWGGREGVETNAAQGSAGGDQVVPRRDQLPVRVRAARRATTYKFALEPKPNEPRGDIFLPTIGHMLAFIYTLDHPGHGRAQPRGRARHDGRARLLARRRAGARGGQALPHRPQRAEAGPLRPGPALRQRGPEGGVLPREAARGLRSGTACATSTATRTAPKTKQGVWDFARGSMRTYLILKEKVARFNADAEIQALLASLRERGARRRRARAFSADSARDAQGRRRFDLAAMRARRATRTSGSIS